MGKTYDEFIANAIAEGRYENELEVLRDGIDRLKEEDELHNTKQWAAWINAEIQKGLDSGPGEEFDWDKFLEEMHTEWNKKDDK